ncbi:META domain-containing protein [Aestuariivirga sp.]|uniref:META domain-containing protein n=1 Tax=Aestuariivirga sp. TaxID=2650926 RepID=UPI0039E3E2D9
MNKVRTISAAMFFVSALACQAAEAPKLDGEWHIMSVTGADGIDSGKAVLKFDGGHASGTIGCNRIAGGYKSSGDTFTFGAMAATMMACPPPLDMQEQAFLKALENVKTVAIKGDEAALKSGDGATLIELKR